MKKWKKIVALIILILILGAAYGLYLYTKKPPDTRKMHAVADIPATTLAEEFGKDEAAASLKYVDKVVIVSGKISSIEKNETAATLILETADPMRGVACSFYEDEIGSLKNVEEGKQVRVKGNCTGVLTDIVLNKCSIVQE